MPRPQNDYTLPAQTLNIWRKLNDEFERRHGESKYFLSCKYLYSDRQFSFSIAVDWGTSHNAVFHFIFLLKHAGTFLFHVSCNVSLSQFDPFDPVKFGKPRRATQFNYFISVDTNWALNWKLAISVGGGLWCARSMSPTNGRSGYIHSWEVEAFWLYVLSRFHRNGYSSSPNTA